MGWTPELDRKLLAAIKAGLSRAQAAELLGMTTNACIARWHRVHGREFPSEAKRRDEAALNARMSRRGRLDAVNKLRHDYEAGMDRSALIRRARYSGMTLSEIGRAMGISRQRIHQIMKAERRPLRVK